MPGIIALVFAVFLGFCGWRIAGRAGYNPWVGLLLAVPLLQLAFLGWLAIARWPILEGDSDPS